MPDLSDEVSDHDLRAAIETVRQLCATRAHRHVRASSLPPHIEAQLPNVLRCLDELKRTRDRTPR